MKRTLSLILVAVLSLGLLAGCGSDPAPDGGDPGNGSTAPAKLRIGLLPTIDGLPFWVAEQEGYFKENGVDVELVTFRSANERDSAIMAGDVDGMLADPVAIVSLAASGTKVKMASVSLGATQEEGTMGILAAPGSEIKTLKQLKGVPIASSKNTVMHYVLEKVLTDEGFTPDEIRLVEMPQIPVRYEALMSGSIEAAILPDPLFDLAASKGANLLLNDKDAKGNYSVSVIAFTEKALEKKSDAVRQFFVGYNQAVADIQVHPDGFKDLLVEKAKLPVEIRDSYKVYPFPFTQAPQREDLESVVQWLQDKGIIQKSMTYQELVDTSVLPK